MLVLRKSWKRWLLLATNIGFPLHLTIYGATQPWLVAELVAHGLMFYSFVAPGCGWLVPVVRRFRTGKKEVWLTIDDGPIDPETQGLAHELALRHARATFFLIGDRLAGVPQMADILTINGHTLANHTTTHPLAWFFALLPGQLAREIDQCQYLLQKTDTTRSFWFRAPFGIKNLFLHDVLSKRRMRLVAWSCRAYDGLLCNPEEIIGRIGRTTQPGDILLMHERGPKNVQAILGVVDELHRRGFSFVIPEDAQLIEV